MQWRGFNRFAKLIALALLSAACLPSARADVWPTQRHWNDEEDRAFSEWIRTLNLSIFTRADSAWKGIPTDCSKAVYVLRTIYAFEHGLPVKFTNRAGLDLSNSSKALDAVPEGKPRVMKFIALLRQHTNTETLVNDTYPIAINRATLRPGAVFLHPKQNEKVQLTYRSGHVYYVQNVAENGMIKLFSSTEPMLVRDLQPRIDVVFVPFTTEGGYRAWKRPDSNQRPGESLEQFQMANWEENSYKNDRLMSRLKKEWSREVRERLAKRRATTSEEMNAAILNVEGYIKERMRLVNLGWNAYQTKYKGQGCMNPSDYDGWSTPTRDVKIAMEIRAARTAIAKHLSAQGDSNPYASALDELEKYKYEVVAGRKVDLKQLYQTYHTRTVISISEPEHSPEVRWGLASQPRWPCPERAKQYVGGDLAGQN